MRSSSTEIEVTCESCGTVLEAPDSAAGRLSTCPTCREPVQIPALPAPITAAAADSAATASQPRKNRSNAGKRRLRRSAPRPTPQPQPKRSSWSPKVFLVLAIAALLGVMLWATRQQTEPANTAGTELVENPVGGAAYDTPDTAGPSAQDSQPSAQWMSGKWGIGWRIKGGSNEDSQKMDVNHLVEQVKTIPGLSYVLFNLSNGANGSIYTAPHAVLSSVNPGVCSKRDLFGEMATAFQAAGYKVLVYLATQGPAQLKHGPRHDTDAKRIENWKAWVRKHYGSDDLPSLKQAYAEVIVREFAQRYGTKIDGWWFDHSSFGNIELIHKEVTKGNPKAIVAFCRGLGTIANESPGYEDYTAGHPIPVRRGPASSKANLKMVTAIEATENGFCMNDGEPSLAHMFMPMKNRWNLGKDIVWQEEQAVDWMQRVLQAGGAWTWNVPFHESTSELNPPCVEFAIRVASQLCWD